MIKVLILVATYLFSMNAMSDGLLRTTNLKSYCGQYDRQTVIYLDQGIISKKDPVLNYEQLLAQIKNMEVEIIKFPDGHMSHIENENFFLHHLVYFIEN